MPFNFLSHWKRYATDLYAACWRRVNAGILAGSLTAIAMSAVLRVEGDRPFEAVAYNQLFQLRGATQWSPEVVVVGIDDKSLAQLGSFPWHRKIHADLLQRLTPAQPSAIAFDIVFAESAPGDDLFADAIKHQRKVVLAQAWSAENKPVSANETLAQSSKLGHIYTTEDTDGVTRSLHTVVESVPALGLVATQVHALSRSPSSAAALADLPAQLWINWPASMRELAHYSYVDVITGAVPASTFTGKIVLVGATAAGIDTLSTPFDRNPPASGVYLHAATVSNVLEGNFLQVPSAGWEIVLLCLGGPGLGWMIGRRCYRTQIFVSIGAAVGWLVASWAMFNVGYWLPVMWPVALAMWTTSASLATAYWQDQKQLRAQLKALKETYGTLLVDADAIDERGTLTQVATNLAAVSVQVSRLVLRDELTQLKNRRCFDRCLENEWYRAMRERNTIAVLMCDIDFFKGFNDTYGHLAGDFCLKQVAIAIESTVARPGDVAARYGGEEFIVVLPNVDAAGAMHVAKSICAAVKALKISNAASQVSPYVTLSIGAAVDVPTKGSLSQGLVSSADKALYSAKDLGRDRAALYDDTTRSPANL